MNAEIIKSIEATWIRRAANIGLKKGTKKYLELQAEFLIGAMACAAAHIPAGLSETAQKAMEAEAMPPRWIFGIMRGQGIPEPEEG